MNKQERTFPNISVRLFVAISYGFSWLAWLPGILNTRGLIGEIPWQPLFALGTCGPLVAAICCVHRSEGWQGVKVWLRNRFAHRIQGWELLFILVIPFAVPALVLSIYHLSVGGINSLPVFREPWIVIPTIILMLTIGGGQEEFGWRGYLLEGLRMRWKPWQVDIFMIVVHSFWHLPLFFISMTMQAKYSFWVFLVFGAGFTLLSNAIYRRTDGFLLVSILFHGMVNSGLEIFPPVGPVVHHSNLPLLFIALIYGLLTLGILEPSPHILRRRIDGEF